MQLQQLADIFSQWKATLQTHPQSMEDLCQFSSERRVNTVHFAFHGKIWKSKITAQPVYGSGQILSFLEITIPWDGILAQSYLAASARPHTLPLTAEVAELAYEMMSIFPQGRSEELQTEIYCQSGGSVVQFHFWKDTSHAMTIKFVYGPWESLQHPKSYSLSEILSRR